MTSSNIIRAMLSGVEGNSTELPALDRLVLFDQAGIPLPPSALLESPDPAAIAAALLADSAFQTAIVAALAGINVITSITAPTYDSYDRLSTFKLEGVPFTVGYDPGSSHRLPVRVSGAGWITIQTFDPLTSLPKGSLKIPSANLWALYIPSYFRKPNSAAPTTSDELIEFSGSGRFAIRRGTPTWLEADYNGKNDYSLNGTNQNWYCTNGVRETLSADLAAGVPITSVPVNSLSQAIPAGKLIQPFGPASNMRVTADAAIHALSITIASYTPAALISEGATIYTLDMAANITGKRAVYVATKSLAGANKAIVDSRSLAKGWRLEYDFATGKAFGGNMGATSLNGPTGLVLSTPLIHEGHDDGTTLRIATNGDERSLARSAAYVVNDRPVTTIGGYDSTGGGNVDAGFMQGKHQIVAIYDIDHDSTTRTATRRAIGQFVEVTVP